MTKLSPTRWITRGALALGLLVTPLSAQDDDGGGFLENLIEDRLSGPGFQVDVRGFEGALSSRATLASLVISDDEGPWLTINNAVLDWNRSALLRGRLSVDELTAEEILLPRLPQADTSVDVPEPEATPFSLPDLPVSIQIGRIAAERVELGQPVIGEAAVLSVEGSASLAGGEGEVDIAANRVDAETGSYNIAGSFSSESRELVVDLGIDEGEGGIVGSLINLPGAPSLELSVEGQGPLSDFTADIALATDGEPRIDGTVTLSESDEGQGFAVDIGGDIAPVFTPQYRPFFGPDIQLSAQGAIADSGAIRLDTFDLAAQSIDLQGQVVIGADGVPDLIDVTGEISGDDGPVVLPVGQDVRVGRVGLDVQFDESVGEDWTGEIVVEGLDQGTLRIARVALDGSGIISGSGDALAVETNFDFDASGLDFDDPAVAEAVGDAIEGRVEVDYTSGGDIAMDVLRLSGAGFSLDGRGSVDPDGENVPMTLDVALDAETLEVFSSLAGRPLSGSISADLDLSATLRDQGFNIELTGTGQDLALGISDLDPLLTGETVLQLAAERDETGLTVRTLTLDNEAIDLDGSAQLSSDDGRASVDARIDDLGRIDPVLEGPATLSFQAVNPGEAWDIDLTASGAQTDIGANVTVSDLEADAPLVEGTADVTARDLSLFLPFAGRDLGGSLDISLNGQGRTDASTVSAEIDGEMQDIAIGQPELDRLLAGVTDLAATFDKNGDRIAIPRLAIENPQISTTGEGNVAPGDSDVDLAIRLPDLSQIVPSMNGPATLTLTADEDAEGWVVDLNGSGAGAEIVADGRVSDLDATPLGAGNISVEIDDLGNFSELARRELAGSVDIDAQGQARFDFSTGTVELGGSLSNIAIGQPEIDRLLSGETDIAADLTKDGDAITIETLNVSNPQVSLTADGQYGTGQNAVQAALVFPELGAIVPEMSGEGRVDLFAEETGEAWQVTLDGAGAGVVLSAVSEITDLDTTPFVDGRVSLDAEDLSRFRTLVDRPLSGALELDAQGNARVDGSQFDVTANLLGTSLSTGIAEVDQLLSGATQLDLVASRSGADAPIQVQTLELDASGLDASAQGTLLGGASDLDFDARLANLGAFVDGIDGPVTVTGSAGQAGSNFTLDVDVAGPQGMQADITGQIAESFDNADLSIDGTAPLRLANPFIEPRSLSGQANFDLAVRGPLALSSLSGQVSLADGRLVEPSLPLVLENVDATAQIGGETIRLSLTAQNQEGGQISVNGPISLTGGFDAGLDISIDDFVVEDPRLYQTEVDGQISVDGALTGGATIGGQLTLDTTEIRIPSTGLGATGPIPDGLVHVDESAAVRATLRRAGLIDDGSDAGSGGGGGAAYPLDITISAPNQIFIRGRGLDSEFGGTLRLQGTTANIIPAGQFELIRGRIDLLGQRIVLTEGIVTLQGDFTPFIRLVAETDAGEVTIRIVVEGPAGEPVIRFESDPELPQDEVLSRLLFGRSIDNISPLQAAQLASAVATLAGRGGDGIIANLRARTGLDDLDVTTDAEGNVGLRAGKYLSENLYSDVTVESGGEAEINLNLDLTDSITVRGGASSTGNTSLGIFYERDY
ncbi:translocation/assembly module TamB domain-containing protein [Palleronia sp. LCG004]|uniref:translocation/assembly module TamB domain-containing protein n=1 Tax=Palleronia sp. LCG004 TaxID=3079304 RepID=UPI002943CD4C|nr:translocation/assembly module TamB domain-containing protein [Palleronia sp. LCG004]WOI56002.1 translocation/assembly module TamB domain-containing protein [Palleronia sp. LCG004]